jgi:hypothetical protein
MAKWSKDPRAMGSSNITPNREFAQEPFRFQAIAMSSDLAQEAH